MKTLQRRFALPALALALAATLSACGSLAPAVDAYGAAALTGARAANDSIIAANKVAICATPVSALVRHPELVPAVRSLCLPATDTGNVGQVLDAIPNKTPAPTT